MADLLEVLDYQFLNNSLLKWGFAALVFLFTFTVLPILRGWVGARRAKWLARSTTHPPTPALELLALLIARTSKIVLIILALYFAEKILVLPPKVDTLFDVVIVVGVWLQVGLWATATLRFFLMRHQSKGGTHDGAAETSVAILMFGAQVIIWALLILLALDNLGVNITALVAGLGIGGVAVALAVQAVLSDLFASLSIAFDKPFVVGERLKIDEFEGAVEHIGLKSTRLRSITGEQIIISNADVLKSRVRNMGRMPERRLQFKLAFPYDTPPEKFDLIEKVIRAAVTSQQNTRFVQCILTNLGPYGPEFETIWFVANRVGDVGNAIVDAVNRTIVKELALAGLTPAAPTQRITMLRENPAP
ncbi:MAG: mechanosensitive ion channel domain-containing protein [Steroidobacteraceae bacterium]